MSVQLPFRPAAATTAPAEQQAGGGVPVTTTEDAREIEEFGPSVLNHMKNVYESRMQLGDRSSAGDFPTFENFLSFMASSKRNALAKPLPQDLTYPISNYFISSSHNTYLTGNQLYSDSSTDGYKNVLLRGCRCVEVDVYDGEPDSSSSSSSPSSSEDEAQSPRTEKRGLRERMGLRKRRDKANNNVSPQPAPAEDVLAKPKPWRVNPDRVEPRVLHGYTLTREVPFRSVCETIRENAFKTSDLPVIVSLEVHTSAEQQEVMVEIMQECWGDMFVDLPNSDRLADEIPLPKPTDLRNKILIKVKYSPPKTSAEAEAAANQLTQQKSENTEDLSSGEEETSKTEQPTRKSKVIEALSRLGVYTRSYHFKSFDQPEAKIPTHVFSLSESALMEVHQQDSAALFRHNKDFLMRAYPKGTRVSSTNLDPTVFWRKGVQIVALNWQKWDAGMMLNEAMFAGYGGWVLKPEGYRSGSVPERQRNAAVRGTLDLVVEIFAGQDIPLPPERETKSFKPYVKCKLHVEKPEERSEADPIPGGGKSQEGEYKQHTKTAKSQDPDFAGERLSFTGVPAVVETLSFVRFKVMHNDTLGRDDLAAWACFRLDRLQEGFRFIHLFDAAGVQSRGVLFVRTTKSMN